MNDHGVIGLPATSKDGSSNAIQLVKKLLDEEVLKKVAKKIEQSVSIEKDKMRVMLSLVKDAVFA